MNSESFADALLMKRAIHILMVTSLITMGMGSCSTTVEEACRTKIPALHQEFAKVQVEVAALAPSREANRAIASVSEKPQSIIAEQNQIFSLSRETKDRLQQWSEEKLVEAEQYQDLVRSRSELRPALQPLSEMADELVKFDGYVETGKVYQVTASLQRAEVHAAEAEKAVCRSLPPTQ